MILVPVLPEKIINLYEHEILTPYKTNIVERKTLLDLKLSDFVCFMAINVKMPTSVGILKLMINLILS